MTQQEIDGIIQSYLTANDEVTQKRLKLDDIVNEIETAEQNFRTVERGVNSGMRYADELDAIRLIIDSKKKERDAISKELKQAVTKSESIEKASIKPVGSKILELWDAVQKSERELRHNVEALRTFTDALPKRRWVWYRDLSPVKRTVLCSSGLRDGIINNGDRLYFENLRKEVNTNE